MRKNFINRILILVCLSLLTTLANAQSPTTIQLRDSQGLPVRVKNYGDTKGSPYLTNEWSKAIVRLQNGQTYSGIDIKYDQLEDELVFKTVSGTELAFAIAVLEFKVTYDEKGTSVTKVFRNGFAPFRGSTDKTFYELLHDGTVKLFKKNGKQIESTQAYNSPPTKAIVDRIKYYYVSNNELMEFKRDAKSVTAAFGSKSTSVQQYVKDNNLNLKKDEDLIKVFAYFSTL